MIRTPRFVTNRYGVFAARILIPATQTGTGKRREVRHSLVTKNPAIARVLALQFNLHFEQARMATKKPDIAALTDKLADRYRLDIKAGVMEATDADDHKRMMEAVKAYRDLHRQDPLIQEVIGYKAGATFTPPKQKPLIKSLRMSKATELYLNEKRHDNEAKTLDEKRSTYAEFLKLFGDLEIDQIDKEIMRRWKATDDGKGNFTANRINKRLSFFSDFLNWGIKNGHYIHGANPCDGLRISNKRSARALSHIQHTPQTSDPRRDCRGSKGL